MSEIHTALAAVMDDCTHVAKRDRNEHQRFLFRGIDAVVNAVGPILRKHAVTVRPVVQSVVYDNVQTSTGKPATACRVVVDYVFSAKDGSEVTATVAAEAWDNGDKAAPKAMSVAFRTALLQTLALPTDEPDPDAHTYERAQPKRAPRRASVEAEKPGDVDGGDPMSAKTRGRMFALFGERGIDDRDEQIRGIAHVIGRQIASRSELTEDEARAVIARLTQTPTHREETQP